jgi:hypothetical protein
MSEAVNIDLFAEDRAHEEFLKAVIHRLARGEKVRVKIRSRSARGGHGKTLSELLAYQKAVLSGEEIFSPVPDLLFVAIDANCDSFRLAHKGIESSMPIRIAQVGALGYNPAHVELPSDYVGVSASFP